jgi:hypothetical protein
MESDHGRIVAVHKLADSETEALLELDDDAVRSFGEAEFERADGDGGDSAAGEWRFEPDRYGYCWVREATGSQTFAGMDISAQYPSLSHAPSPIADTLLEGV